jgi:hypothetical protein
MVGSLDMVRWRVESGGRQILVLGSMLGVGKTERQRSHLTVRTPVKYASASPSVHLLRLEGIMFEAT